MADGHVAVQSQHAEQHRPPCLIQTPNHERTRLWCSLVQETDVLDEEKEAEQHVE